MSARALSAAPRCEAEDQGGWPCCTYLATHCVAAKDTVGGWDVFFCSRHATDEGNRFYRADQMVPFRKLTKLQRGLLEHANRCTPPHPHAVRFEFSGIGAHGGQCSTVRSLEVRGFVEYVDHGRIEDDDNGDAERPIYAITDRGRAMLAKLGATEADSFGELRLYLADPTGMIECECADPAMKQKDVALTYAIAIRDESVVPVDWKRANAAIVKRWPDGLVRVKETAWRLLRKQQVRMDTHLVTEEQA